MKFFNTAGPINPKDHYYVPYRFDGRMVRQLLDQKKYFILHAPRQSGKTTSVRVFVDELNEEGIYRALYINVEPAQVARNNIPLGVQTIVNILRSAIEEKIEASESIIAYIDQRVKDGSPLTLFYDVLRYLGSVQ